MFVYKPQGFFQVCLFPELLDYEQKFQNDFNKVGLILLIIFVSSFSFFVTGFFTFVPRISSVNPLTYGGGCMPPPLSPLVFIPLLKIF